MFYGVKFLKMNSIKIYFRSFQRAKVGFFLRQSHFFSDNKRGFFFKLKNTSKLQKKDTKVVICESKTGELFPNFVSGF